MKRFLALLPVAAADALAQCVMCGRTAAAQNEARAEVLNTGIFILLIPPLVIFAAFLMLAWRRRKA